MARESHRPERTCIGCMKRAPKSAMVRLAVNNDLVVPDFDSKAPGRGAYLHRNVECLERFVASRVKEFRSLRRRIERGDRVEIVRIVKQRLDREPQVE